MNRSEAKDFINAIVALRESASDQQASLASAVYPKMKEDAVQDISTLLIKAGTRINWNGTIKRAAVDLWDIKANNPDNAPALWEDVLYKNGIRIIPETITAGTAFAKGEQGWWKDKIYISLLDTNVWTPEQNPSGWKVETE